MGASREEFGRSSLVKEAVLCAELGRPVTRCGSLRSEAGNSGDRAPVQPGAFVNGFIGHFWEQKELGRSPNDTPVVVLPRAVEKNRGLLH